MSKCPVQPLCTHQRQHCYVMVHEAVHAIGSGIASAACICAHAFEDLSACHTADLIRTF